jgi:iron(III) transport system permease protein
VLPVLLLVVLSLLPLAYVGLKAWQAGWAEALHLLWRPMCLACCATPWR